MFKYLTIALIIGVALSSSFSGSNYEAQTRQAKIDQLWDQITSDSTPGSFPSTFKLAGIFLESMDPTFSHVGDTLPDGRVKYIHSVGVVSKVAYVPEPNQPFHYTGIFEGADSGLLRLSVAKTIDTTKTTAEGADDNFTPGLGIKFLRNGQPSANLLAMFGVNGFPSWNFFFKDASNHIPKPHGAAQAALSAKFASATPRVATIGIKDLADFTQDGSTRSAVFPFQLIFRAPENIKNLFSDDFQESYMTQLQKIPAGSIVYDVYTIDAPNACETKIGSIKTLTEFVSSKFGDESLFFRHNWMEEDVKVHPDWDDYVPQYKNLIDGVQVNKESKCPFGY